MIVSKIRFDGGISYLSKHLVRAKSVLLKNQDKPSI